MGFPRQEASSALYLHFRNCFTISQLNDPVTHSGLQICRVQLNSIKRGHEITIAFRLPVRKCFTNIPVIIRYIANDGLPTIFVREPSPHPCCRGSLYRPGEPSQSAQFMIGLRFTSNNGKMMKYLFKLHAQDRR